MADKLPELELARHGVDYAAQITCRNLRVLVRPLSISELQKITATVINRLEMLDEKERNPLAENLLVAKETLRVASTSDVDKTDEKLTEYILDRMTPSEVQHLLKQYHAMCDRVNPSLDLLTPEELQKLVDALKKSPPEELAYQLTTLSFSDLVSIAHSLLTPAA